jgi:hypothetical protein
MTRPVTWPGVGVQTLDQPQRKHRRLHRTRVSVAQTLTAMGRGCTLHLSFERGCGGGCSRMAAPFPTKLRESSPRIHASSGVAIPYSKTRRRRPGDSPRTERLDSR